MTDESIYDIYRNVMRLFWATATNQIIRKFLREERICKRAALRKQIQKSEAMNKECHRNISTTSYRGKTVFTRSPRGTHKDTQSHSDVFHKAAAAFPEQRMQYANSRH